MILATYSGVVVAVFLFLAGLGGGLPRWVPGSERPAAVPALAETDPDAGGAGVRGSTPAPSAPSKAEDADGQGPSDLWHALADRLWGWQVALRRAWPGHPPADSGPQNAPGGTDSKSLGRRVVERTLEQLSGIRWGEPLSLVAAQMPVAHDVELFEEEGGPVVGRLAPPDLLVGGLPNVRPSSSPQQSDRVAVAGGQPQVLIYHTHTSEAYVGAVPTSSGFDPAVAAFTSDPAASVVGVGAVVQSELEQQGIGVIHLRQVFDREGERVTRIGNYQRALAVLAGSGGESILERYPSVNVVIDIHRDGVGRSHTVATVRGQTMASLLFVVGTDRRLEHPQWHKNYCFAQWIVARLNQNSPGLVKGVLVSDNRYNQHVRPGAILVEVGGYGNTPEEAERSARLLGQALANVIRDGRVPQADRPFPCPPGVQPPR